jgi:Fe-S-cluster containining protein
MAAVDASAILTFLILAMVTKIITGEEHLVYYHHEIAILAAASLGLWGLRQPLLPFLDLTILGLGLFLVCGRMGCLMVGCCHGRPHWWGVRYRPEHVVAGFTPHFAGMRLFPVQGLEAVLALIILLTGIVWVAQGAPPGTALAWYVVAYGVGRFGLEFLRGDTSRPYFWGFSEAQWTSLFLLAALAGAEISGRLPWQLWHLAVAGGLGLAVAGLGLLRKAQPAVTQRLFQARHIQEIGAALQGLAHGRAASRDSEQAQAESASIQVASTSLGLQLSLNRFSDPEGCFCQVTFSGPNGGLSDKAAGRLAYLLLKMGPASGGAELLRSGHGVFHLLIHPLAGSVKAIEKNSPRITALTADLRQEVVQGFLYSHSRMNANTQLAVENQALLAALVERLSQKGVLEADELAEPQQRAVAALRQKLSENCLGMMIHEQGEDKYGLEQLPIIDCSSRISLCRAACCRLSFALSAQDIQEGVVQWELGRPYLIGRGQEGYCAHLDPESLSCTVYGARPGVCRQYDCRQDQRIWTDFDRRLVNPDIATGTWPPRLPSDREALPAVDPEPRTEPALLKGSQR